MATAIKVENLSKAYQLGEIGTGTISRDLERWFAKLRGKEDPFLTVGEENDRTSKGTSGVVWSLKDINFEIEQGDAVGIIGRNGAGKSTLLKILSRVTSPTSGRISGQGRIASLLEVGTGFHPELTGKENIYLNGAILGMRKKEIQRKFDEIVDFSGVERYIDTPVKRYSSGMYVRLAFAVAAHLESEILIVDEVLAVGDAEFQRKCLGKMGEVSKGEGRTVLFVSHNMPAVQKLCTKGIFLKNGKVNEAGTISSIIDNYISSNEVAKAIYEIPEPRAEMEVEAFPYLIKIEDLNGNSTSEIQVGKKWQIRVHFKINKALKHFIVGLSLTNSLDSNLRTTWSNPFDSEVGEYVAIFKEEHILFAPGTYQIAIGLSSFERSIFYAEGVASLFISDATDEQLDKTIIRTTAVGLFLNPMNVEISKNL